MNNNNVDEVVLYSLPPSWSFLPMAGIACISEYLNNSNLSTKISYLNLSFENKIKFFKIGQSEQEILSFFILILERLEGLVDVRLSIIQKFVESSFPKILLVESEYSSAILGDLIEEVINIIDENIKNYEDVVLHGFSSKFNQWISATVVAKRIKKVKPDANLVIGGWTNKRAAIDFLQSNNCFTYAIWGEGEIAILKLVKWLKGSSEILNLDNIPGLIYNDNGVIKESMASSQYISEGEMLGFDYSDYFKSLKDLNFIPNKIYIPIERSRGCHWNKCEFCYLNQGYLFRTKCNQQIIAEIRSFYSKYKLENYNISFAFMDNDIVGNDVSQFESLLECFIDLKKEYPNFEIGSAEMITKDLDHSLISKMKKAGIKNVQIGLEAVSPSLLKKINKKQTFSENLFFMIEATYFDIEVSGANIIYNTLDETIEDLIQSIDNLYFLRFLSGKIEFNLIPLGVANHSRYLKRLQKNNQDSQWTYNPLAYMSNLKYTEKVDRFSLFDYTSEIRKSPLWDVFEKNLQFYSNSKFRYKISDKGDGFVYKEYFGRKKVKEIEFDEYKYKKLLKFISTSTFSIDELIFHLGYVREELLSMLVSLKAEGLVYYTDNFKGITSIIRI